MSKKKDEQPNQKSSSLLGFMALFAVIAAIAVFAFAVRSPQTPQREEPPQQQTQVPSPAQEPQQAPAQQAPPAEDHSGHDHDVPVPSPLSAAERPLPPFYENPDQAEPLARTLDPATVAPHAREAYQVAMEKPRLMAQLPCFCYCNRFGHKSLHDCYVSNHAEECDICMKEALEASKMQDQGMSPQDIRSVIISTYHQRS